MKRSTKNKQTTLQQAGTQEHCSHTHQPFVWGLKSWKAMMPQMVLSANNIRQNSTNAPHAMGIANNGQTTTPRGTRINGTMLINQSIVTLYAMHESTAT